MEGQHTASLCARKNRRSLVPEARLQLSLDCGSSEDRRFARIFDVYRQNNMGESHERPDDSVAS
jgi:hypothetical protein